MSLKLKLDEQKKNFEKMAPDDALVIMHRATDELRDSGIMDRVLKIGDRAPEFNLLYFGGQDVTSSQLLASGPLVLTFYRGKW
jgi:hypothetical protein